METSNITWITQQRRVGDLRPLEQNPFGKITDRNKRRLAEKMKKLGVFEIPTLDTNNDLLTFNKRWHILMELGHQDDTIDVRVPDRALSEQERKEVILSSNIHEGEWDKQILKDLYEEIDLDGLGLDIEFDDLAGLDNDYKADSPEYPTVARFSEKYDAIVIVSNNEIDTNYLAEVLGLEVSQCYKSQRVGRTHVVPAEKFIEQWKSK